MAVTSLVLGIVAIVFSVIGLGFPMGALMGIVGVALGAVAKKKNPENGMATGGLVCSIIGTVLSLLFFIACAACIGSAASLL